MSSFYRIPDEVRNDLEDFKGEVEKYLAGEFTKRTFQALRVPRGIYEQRTDDTYMVRIRIPGGGLYPDQMRRIASLSERFGNGVVHLTTRQDVQIHYAKLKDVNETTDQLLEVGLTSKGGGGNTVRNITACDLAGVCPEEVFDVTPYAVALTEYLVARPDSFNLPRKFKIAFSGCASDCALATVNDLGFIAKRRGGFETCPYNGVRGFKVYVAGGMGAHSRIAEPLEEFVPAGEIGYVAEAVKQLFHQYGDRKNRQRARLRFVMERLGREKFEQLYREELKKVKEKRAIQLEVREIEPTILQDTSPGGETGEEDPAFRRWRKFNVHPQKQDGYFAVVITVPLGNISAGELVQLASLAEEFGEGTFRSSQNQNLVLRWVPKEQLYPLYRKLSGIGDFAAPADSSDVVSCPGADTCRLGICLSRNLAVAVRNGLNHDEKKVSIKINGCPNACGQHPIAQIGLQGEARRVSGNLAPYYKIFLGGRVEEGKTALASLLGEIPARSVPSFLKEFLDIYNQNSNGDFYEFLDETGWEEAEGLVGKFAGIPSLEEDESYHIDWGAESQFSLAGRGEGECGAGVLALIEDDLKTAEQSLIRAQRAEDPAEILFEGLLSAARALLVTRGVEAKTPSGVFYLFTEHFITTGLASPKFLSLFRLAEEEKGRLPEEIEEIKEFVSRVRTLYESLDISTLQFRTEEESSAAEGKVVETMDLRGVKCPFNYVKIKLQLEQMEPGERLEALLDPGEPIENVPASVRQDGHRVLELKKQNGYYLLKIQKTS